MTPSYLIPNWPAPPCIKAYTTTRHSWGKNPANPTEREQLKNLLQLPSTPFWLKQIHSNTVVKVSDYDALPIGDASFTDQSNQVCLILTADCLPIFLCHQDGIAVAAIHAGWRGLAHGVIENTLAAMPYPASTMMAWLGPAIGPNRFEVGLDVFDIFTNHDQNAARCFQQIHDDKWLANLYELARLRLATQGLTRVYGGEHCTHTEDSLFFSYRRDKGHIGRMASAIWMTNDKI